MTEKIEEPNPQGKTTNPMDNQQETKEKNTKSNDWCSIRTELPALVFFSFKLLGFKRFGSMVFGSIGSIGLGLFCLKRLCTYERLCL